MPPAGFKRSRALWDEARRPRANKSDQWKALLRAILYELQPIRLNEEVSVSRAITLVQKRLVPFLQRVTKFIVHTILPQTWFLLKNMTIIQWFMVAAAVVYYFIVRWIHETLDAGPVVVMMTTLVAIFTIGLRDKAEGEVSAYSVFNRGFQRLLGSVNVEDLVQQHVGGGMMMGAADADPGPPVDNNNNNRNPRRNQPPAPPAAAAARRNQDENDDDYNSESDSDGDDDNHQNPQPNRARKSGKKARRKNREERMELRRQREAAMALGFDGTGGPEEIQAMQRLLDDQQ